jgi:DUF1009 family protein
MALALKPGERVGLIAGGGLLPLQVARALREAGQEPFVLIVDGEPNLAPELAEFDSDRLPVERFGSFIRSLRAHRTTHVVMAGSITRRPKWSSVEWSWDLARMLAAAAPALAKGDDALLKAIVGQFERFGMKVVGPHEFVPQLVAQFGPMTAKRPDAQSLRDIDAGLKAALAIGALDIGQGAVSVGGRVIALEGIEGTDGLLARVKELRNHGRLAGRLGGVLVKCAKPGQELRADLPGMGSRTIEDVHAAGLAGIAVEAGRTLIVDYADAIRRADELGVFVIGIKADQAP